MFSQQAATNLYNILTEAPSSITPTLETGDITRNALLKVAETLKRADKIPEPSSNPTTVLSSKEGLES